MSENSEIANEKKEPVVFENVEVYIESLGKSYYYFMTDDIKVVCKKLNSLGYRSVRLTDWRINPYLAKSVREKMEELGCSLSMILDSKPYVLNFWISENYYPSIIYLKDLIPSDDWIERKKYNLRKSIARIDNNREKLLERFTSPLMLAAMLNSIEYAKTCIEEGADVNFLNEDGITPLMVAVVNKNKEFVKFLIENGADVNYCTNHGASILVFAIMNNKDDCYTEIIKMLRDAGARTDNTCLKSKIPEKRLTFYETLNFFISQFTWNGLGKPSQIYKNTLEELDKRAFSKIRSLAQKNPSYRPKKNTVFLLAIGMNLTVDQTEQLLFSAGYAFAETSKFDMTIKDFIQKRNYKIEEIENVLFKATGKYLGRKAET